MPFYSVESGMPHFFRSKPIPEHAQNLTPNDGLVYVGAPRQFRFDGQTGKFKLGADTYADYLACQIFDYRWTHEERWGRKPQSWMDLAIVDLDNCVGILPLKKDSAVHLLEFFIEVEQQRLLMESLLVCLEGEKRESSDGEPWYVLRVKDYSFADISTMQRVQAFKASCRFDWILSGEIDAP